MFVAGLRNNNGDMQWRIRPTRPSASTSACSPSSGNASSGTPRASLFAAQALARDLISAGRENEVQEIREFISTTVPDPDA